MLGICSVVFFRMVVGCHQVLWLLVCGRCFSKLQVFLQILLDVHTILFQRSISAGCPCPDPRLTKVFTLRCAKDAIPSQLMIYLSTLAGQGSPDLDGDKLFVNLLSQLDSSKFPQSSRVRGKWTCCELCLHSCGYNMIQPTSTNHPLDQQTCTCRRRTGTNESQCCGFGGWFVCLSSSGYSPTLLASLHGFDMPWSLQMML